MAGERTSSKSANRAASVRPIVDDPYLEFIGLEDGVPVYKLKGRPRSCEILGARLPPGYVPPGFVRPDLSGSYAKGLCDLAHGF